LRERRVAGDEDFVFAGAYGGEGEEQQESWEKEPFAAAERRPTVARGETPGISAACNSVAEPSARPERVIRTFFQGFRKTFTPGYRRSPLRGCIGNVRFSMKEYCSPPDPPLSPAKPGERILKGKPGERIVWPHFQGFRNAFTPGYRRSPLRGYKQGSPLGWPVQDLLDSLVCIKHDHSF
jgi:hypothetical protein